jgi:Pregnancy-associated plasma protein-A
MKITKRLILTGLVLLIVQWVFSQPICGFDAMHRRKLKEDPAYRQHVLDGEASIRAYLRTHPKLAQPPPSITITGSPKTLTGTALYTIPVVVHVVHTGDVIGTIYNPPDAQIMGAIQYLNDVYNGSYPGTAGAGDLQIQFALAQRDPNCNPTNGINRINGSSIAGYASAGVQVNQTAIGTADVNVKNLIRWDPTRYYNIWIVDKIDGADGTGSSSFVAGFAYFPGSSASEDGIVMLATQMISGQKTLPHEIGHAFNLYHPFQSSDPNGQICDPNTDCTVDGDQICDTDPVTEPANFVCRSGTNACNGLLYSANTESNYMNYTFCYTLFTADQKARMLASAAGPFRLSLSTSQGGTAPNAGASPCIPLIDFELSGDQVTEATAASSGCRSYTDYSYNMVIGNNPSAAATATLSKNSGTAVQGVDFDLTTNGSFTSPSSTLTFPAGSNSSRPFTLRIYDDVSINGTRSFTLGYTVNNGGGNAAAGSGRTAFTMIINDNDLPPTGGTATGTVSIGPASFGFMVTPFDASQASERTQFLYKATELTAAGIPAGPITAIALHVFTKHSIRPFTNLNIKLGTATVSYLVDASGAVSQGVSMTIVKSLASYTTTVGWDNFVFDRPFTWDGVSNLVVEVCYDNITPAPSDAGDLVGFYNDGATGNQDNTIYQDSVGCSAPFNRVFDLGGGGKPSLQLTYGFPPTVVQTVLNSSAQQDLGPNTDIYFYDQTNGQLMARIQNLSGFNYGCTQIQIDRQGTGTAPFWNNNTANYLMAKTFHVLPTTNNPSGNYNITLYYTQAEINGWQTATGQSLGNIQLIKVAGQISSVTPASPSAGGAMVTGAPAISSMGTNTGLTAGFATGFSGFGAGVPGLSILPIGLLDFEGHLANNSVDLDWSTSTESNNKGFGVERSVDGSSYVDIGFVDGAGNSSLLRKYSLIDPSPVTGNNFYRLKQTDLDLHYTYSKTIVIDNPNASRGPFTVLSNPFTTSLDIVFGQTPLGKVNVRLLDATGKELLRQSGTQPGFGRWHIDLSGRSLAAGVYLLEVGYNGEIHTEKLLKE